MKENVMDGTTMTRRTALTAAATGGCALFLAACSGASKSDDPTVSTTTTSAGTTSAATSAAATSAATSAAATTAPAGKVIAALADVPVGGAVAVSDGSILLAQPTAGTVVGYNATCPHMGTLIKVKGTLFECPNHMSRFKFADGSLINGPAETGLKTVAVSVSGANVVET
jgi:nitrite reductase/ring-hydroxylating ferredoxin subunit